MLSIEVLDLHGDVHKYEEIDYLLWTNSETYGKPQILAPGTEAHDNDDQLVVLYVNPLATAAVRVEKDDLPG